MIEFENVGHSWIWLLMIVAGCWALYATYRGIFQRSERRLTWGLMALRGAGLLALVLALAKPTWTRDTERVDPGRLAVVVDNSISMSLADPSGKSRYALANEAIGKLRHAVESDESGRPLIVDLFDVEGNRIAEVAAPQPRAELTDLVRAVSESVAQLRSKLLVGVVLVSDGADNTGREDTLELGETPVPIYSVGFTSDPEASRLDLAVADVQAPERVLVGNEIKVNVLVSKTSGPATEASVTIRRGGDDFSTATVSLGEGSDQQRVGLSFTPDEAGSFVYTARVDTNSGERLLANNARHFPLQVDADAIRVLYLEGFLRYEYKFLKNRLEDDPDVSLVTMVRRTNPDRVAPAEGERITAEQLENLDLVILGDMEGDYLEPSEYQALVSWVDAGHALLVLGGYRSFGPDGFRTTPLADVLPVVFAEDGPQQSEDPFELELTERGRQHPIFEITGDRVKDASLWSTAPHLLGSSLIARAKSAAEVLAVNPNLTVDEKPAVVIATGRYGSGHAMVIAADTTWRWTRLTRVLGQSDTLYSRFWSQTVRWLTGRELDQERQRLVVHTNRPDYQVGKEVAIRVLHQKDAGTPGGEAGQVGVEVVDETGKRVALAVRTGSAEPDVWKGSFYPSAGGRYQVQATLNSGGKTIANETTEFLVHGSELELADTRVNRPLLEAIAGKTGGVYLNVEDVDELPSKLERKERRIARVERTEYWNNPFLFLFFLTVVTAEWVLRRRNHLV